jgi:hypothetical protein
LRAATITVAIPNATKRIVEEIVSLIPEQNADSIAERAA